VYLNIFNLHAHLYLFVASLYGFMHILCFLNVIMEITVIMVYNVFIVLLFNQLCVVLFYFSQSLQALYSLNVSNFVFIVEVCKI